MYSCVYAAHVGWWMFNKLNVFSFICEANYCCDFCKRLKKEYLNIEQKEENEMRAE